MGACVDRQDGQDEAEALRFELGVQRFYSGFMVC